MGVSSAMNHALKMLDYMRSARRVNSRVQVAVEWNEKGETHRAEGYTVDISPKGCLAVVPQGFPEGQDEITELGEWKSLGGHTDLAGSRGKNWLGVGPGIGECRSGVLGSGILARTHPIVWD